MILTGMMTWWKEQMRDLVPASLRSSLGRNWRPELVAAADSPDPSDITLFLRARGGETALGRHALTGTALRDAVARLPRAHRKAAESAKPIVAEEKAQLNGFMVRSIEPGKAVIVETDGTVRTLKPSFGPGEPTARKGP